jgi:hypothetical protein
MGKVMQPRKDEATTLQDAETDDPHAVLELHPHAPRELIERVYWHLAAMAQRRDDQTAAAAVVQRLNRAYNALVDAMRERSLGNGAPPRATVSGEGVPVLEAHVNGNGHDKQRRGLFAKRNDAPKRRPDAYELLRVHRAASQDVIRIAYEYRRAQLKGASHLHEERERLDDAYEHLSDGERREVYDRMHPAPRKPGEVMSEIASRIAALKTEAPAVSPSTNNGADVAAVTPVAESTPAATGAAAPPGVLKEPAATAEPTPAATIAERHDAVVDEPAAPPEAVIEEPRAVQVEQPAAPASSDVAEAPTEEVRVEEPPPASVEVAPAAAAEMVAPKKQRGAKKSSAAPEADATADATAPDATTTGPNQPEAAKGETTDEARNGLGGLIGQFARKRPTLHAPSSEHRALEQRLEQASPVYTPATREGLERAEQERLMTLRDDTIAPVTDGFVEPVAAARPTRDPADARAYLTFVTGIRAGEALALDGDMLTLGTSPRSGVILPDEAGKVARDHARIWRSADNFLMREVDGTGTTIGGASLMSPIVVLEDGDEIQIGPYRMRFSLAAAPAGAAAG